LVELMEQSASGSIFGKATLLVTFGLRLEAQAVLSALGVMGYPVSDVRIYYRPIGTDQVIDALTGQVPAGESLQLDKLRAKEAQNLETLVLMHPDAAQFVAVQEAFKPLGEADYKYAEAVVFEGTQA
jgi:hypothetical protein